MGWSRNTSEDLTFDEDVKDTKDTRGVGGEGNRPGRWISSCGHVHTVTGRQVWLEGAELGQWSQMPCKMAVGPGRRGPYRSWNVWGFSSL